MLSKEWAAQKFKIKLMVITGIAAKGSYPTNIYNKDETGPGFVWMTNHVCTDGAGKGAHHFTLVCKESCQIVCREVSQGIC